jgi:hypothetical protein
VVLVASLLLIRTVLGGGQSVSVAGPLAVSLIATARLVGTGRRQVALACGSALALALGSLGGIVDVLAGSLVAVAFAAIPAPEAEEVAG